MVRGSNKQRHSIRAPRQTPDRRPGEKPKGAPPKPREVPWRPFETFEATFSGMVEGTGGFLRPVGMTRADNLDLRVDWRDQNGAIHNDRVMAELTGQDFQGRLRGRVIKVLGRGELPIPCTLQQQAFGWRAVPLEPRIQQLVVVPPTDLAGEGDLVSVLLDKDPTTQQLKGKVLAKLGRPTDLRIENKLTAALFNLRTEFPDAVMQELAPFPTSIPEEWAKGREDLRKILTCTIDPPTARDFDDAISLESLPDSEGGGWILGVHIADVSHYVQENGPLDLEAKLRGTSVYFPDECIPMIPERLSGDLCSLREKVDRLTMTAWMTLSPSMEVIETRFSESVIHSRKRLTYDDVKHACLDGDRKKQAELGPELMEMLSEALAVSRSLTAKRLERGAMNLDTIEIKFEFGEDGRVTDAQPYERHDAHKMIEEFMLLANEAVASFFTRKKLPTMYRIHDNPDPLKLEIFAETARAFGLLTGKDKPTPEVLNAMLLKVKDTAMEALINTLLLRSLKKAEYSAENIGHSGLALDDYLHFTSPIRRYPDLIVHRLLRRVLRGEKLAADLQGQLANLAKQCSDAEQKATEAERENDKWKACLLMKDKIGKRYRGRIAGLSPKAMFVQLEHPWVEAGVPLGALGSDFVMDEHRTTLTGKRGQVVLHIGDVVQAEITAVDEELRRVSAWVVEVQARDGVGKPFQFIPTLSAPARLTEDDLEKPKSRFEGRSAGERGRRDEKPRGRAPKKAREAAAGGESRKPKHTFKGSSIGAAREASPRPPKGTVRSGGKGPRKGGGGTIKAGKKRG
ncbi:MAG: ribonuclease R [Acidobacteria bacterium]|nr:ribonuclease R [Acidobacteriota bacterium]